MNRLLKKITYVLFVIIFVIGIHFGYKKIFNKYNKELLKAKEMSDKHFRLFKLMNNWTNAKIRGTKVVDYLKENNIKSVAIYGLSYVGQTLISELEKEDIDIKYGIDQNPEFFCQDFEVISPNDELPSVDMIIITAVFYFDEIKSKLQKRVNTQIVSLEEIVEYI